MGTFRPSTAPAVEYRIAFPSLPPAGQVSIMRTASVSSSPLPRGPRYVGGRVAEGGVAGYPLYNDMEFYDRDTAREEEFSGAHRSR